MSLLMDALRRAEEAKRAVSPAKDNPGAAVPAAEMTIAPMEMAPPPPGRTLPPAELLDDLDTDLTFDVPASQTPAMGSKPATKREEDANRQAAERSAAKNVFAVKEPPRGRTSLWLFLGLLGVAIIAIGGYFWWQLQSISSTSLAQSSPLPAVQAPSPTQSPVAVTPTAAATPLTITASATPEPLQSLTPPPSRPPASESKAASPAKALVRSTRRMPAEPAATGNGVNFARPAINRTRPDQTLAMAYEAWLDGRLDDARRRYEHVLQGDPKNTDALLGLAAIATRQGQSDRAQSLYQRVLDADPSDATAQAALINLRAQNDGGSSESRLRTLLTSQPDSPSLHFALGNLWARQGRWRDAQQSYFQAYSLEPDNADYLFNVAVSLDHLRQAKLAAQYYRMALNAAETRHGAFDRSVAARRIAELQP